MQKPNFLHKLLIVLPLLLSSFLLPKPAQAKLQARDASVNNLPTGNLVNYYGVKLCFGSIMRNYIPRGNQSYSGHFSTHFFVGKLHDGYCNYPLNGSEERTSHYRVAIDEDHQVFWRRDTAGIRQLQNQVGNRKLRWVPIHRGKSACGVYHLNGYHVGELTQIKSGSRSRLICKIGFGGRVVEFQQGDFDIPIYVE
ncbi:hypothetical protein PN466_08690 [Roseofilum reptotaenium CS-1145]|uniref:Uncharacterized protein n=1 Tax=Roseofilum reptotaenium AO1-A TaxID=1925591 RepID=A0A1L9QR76_9CYAN|nr:hypothetical protein [Roseofilum reptotaenium]MDB9517024.1 hypothetical protein [Roseofilum reptotaenium CS-1145]OJJ25153.1 hypothetical protein BI308_13275 [Roseofilum reptotaenium AO1-A]